MSALQMKTKTDFAAALAILGASFYWMFTYSGPYRYLAELQLRAFHQYSPKLTMFAIVLGLLGILALAKLLLRGAERPAPSLPQGNTPGIAGGKPGSNVSMAFASPFWRLWFLAIPLVMGGYFLFNAAQAGELKQLRAGDFDSGQVTARVLYADVRGQLSQAYLMKDTYMYIPMYDSAAPSRSVHLLVGVDKARVKTYLHQQGGDVFTVRGMVQRDLEGDVKVAFQKNGIALAEQCWVVHTGRDPDTDKKAGLIIIGVTAALAAAMAGWVAYQDKKKLAAKALPLRATT